MLSPLCSIIQWAHQVLAEVLQQGDLAVDLTAGNGSDTLFLAHCVASQGRVFAFDVQRRALENTAERLSAAHVTWQILAPGEEPDGRSRVLLVADGHEHLDHHLRQPVRAVIANLGYLPGSDRSVITRPKSTLAAVHKAAALLQPGGRMAIVVYTGHPGGREEGAALEADFAAWQARGYHVTKYQALNLQHAPYLLLVEKR